MHQSDQVVVYLLDIENQQLRPISAAPYGAYTLPALSYEENGRLDNILTEAKPHFIQLSELAKYSLNGVPSTMLYNPSQALIVPLVTGHETIGMLTLTFSNEAYQPIANLHVLGTFANQAAITIKNAQLFEGLQKAYEELQQLDQLKTEFINIAAHELRTPLGAILGHASSAEKRASPKLKKYVKFIVISAVRMRTMIDAMLTIQRLDAGTTFLKVNITDIRDILHKVVAD
jgi:signal transduction histidine kinase